MGSVLKIGKSFHRNECQNHQRLLHYVLKNAKNLDGEDHFCFQQDSAPFHKAAKRRQKWVEVNLPDFFFIMRLACIVTESQLIRLFCMGMHFG
jgi:hypothetical protein